MSCDQILAGKWPYRDLNKLIHPDSPGAVLSQDVGSLRFKLDSTQPSLSYFPGISHPSTSYTSHHSLSQSARTSHLSKQSPVCRHKFHLCLILFATIFVYEIVPDSEGCLYNYIRKFCSVYNLSIFFRPPYPIYIHLIYLLPPSPIPELISPIPYQLMIANPSQWTLIILYLEVVVTE